jgi:superfamily II DNA/RNA helicase
MSFASLGLSPAIVAAVDEVGHQAPTLVQAAVIPAVLAGGDVWASAETGSGKTAAFVLPLLERQSQAPRRAPRPVRVLVLAPTRELATQIAGAFDVYGQGLAERLKTCVVVGGVAENPQMMALRGGADIVVATPGRLLDLVEKNALSLSSVQTLVLDEADCLLAMGFGRRARAGARVFATSAANAPALGHVSAGRRGAGLDPATSAHARASGGGRAGDTADHATSHRGGRRQAHAAAPAPAPGATVASRVGLRRQPSRRGPRHGQTDSSRHRGRRAALDLSQGARTRALQGLKSGVLQVLVATDVAARGLDIRQLPAVVNYDLPRSPIDYLHRIGRTGRAGAAGEAVSFVTADGDAHFALIERRHQLRLAREQVPGFERTEVAAPRHDPHGGIKGRRKSKKDKLREAAALAAERARG